MAIGAERVRWCGLPESAVTRNAFVRAAALVRSPGVDADRVSCWGLSVIDGVLQSYLSATLRNLSERDGDLEARRSESDRGRRATRWPGRCAD